MFATIFGWIVTVLPVIPSLVRDIEQLWSGKPKSGQAKWLSVEQALSGSISDVAATAAKLAPAGTSEQAIPEAVVIFSRAVNDAAVALANTLQLFPHNGKPAANNPSGSAA